MIGLKPMGYVLIAVILFIIALGFGTTSKTWEIRGGAPNTVAGLTACGFAIAGGLSLVAGAIGSLRQGQWPQKPDA